MKKYLLAISGLLILLCLSYLIIDQVERYSYLYVSALWIVTCFSLFFVVGKPNTKLRLCILYTGCAFIAFGLAELFFSGLIQIKKTVYNNFAKTEVVSGSQIKSHPILGKKTSENSKYIERRYAGEELVFSYTHTTNEFGWRNVTGKDSLISKEAVLFFGCSYTYGLGVEDDETTASQLQSSVGSEYSVFNFAGNGYGPHQMLAILENDLEEEAIADKRPRVAIFQALQDHLSRITGEAVWDLQGPNYELTENNELVYSGAFNTQVKAGFKKLVAKSFLLRRIFLGQTQISDHEIDLMAHIVKNSSDLFEEKYDGKFYVILWEEKVRGKENYQKLYEKLVELGLTVIEIKDILPDYYPQSPTYFIEGDNHPNAHAYHLISEYIKQNILE